MKQMKRMLALILALVMIVGVLPMSVLAEELGYSEWANFEDNTHYLFFATDRHANTSVIGNIINNMESTIGENKLGYLGLGGDMVGSSNSHPYYTSSTVLSEVTNATTSLKAANVDIVAGIHDVSCNDDAGILLPYTSEPGLIYEGEDYYVYGVPESAISGGETYNVEDANGSKTSSSHETNPEDLANDFVTWANGSNIDKSKVIIVLSHYPLHAKRGDNEGAYYWHKALNTVATGSDSTVERNIVFFHGHNHTVDSEEYVYNVGESMSIQNGSSTTSDTIYYTYATAGYLNQNKKATLVTITGSTITLTKYGTSGSGTAMASVTRVEQIPQKLRVTGKTDYIVGDSNNDTIVAPSLVEVEFLNTATNTTTIEEITSGYELSMVTDANGKKVTLTNNQFTTAGTYNLIYTCTIGSYQAKATLTVTVKEAAVTAGTANCWDDTEMVYIEVATDGVTAVEATNVTKDNAKYAENFTTDGYVALDIELTGNTDGADVEYSISVVADMDTTNLELYYVDADGNLVPVEFELTTDELNNVYIEFTSSYVGTFIYGSAAVPEGYTLYTLTLAGIPTDVFAGVSLDMTNAVITATYTKEGAEDFVRVLTIYDYTEDNWYYPDEVGKQTFSFTFEGKTATMDIYVWYDEFTGGGEVTVRVGEEEYGVTGANVAASSNSNVESAIASVIKSGTYVAYDITLSYAEGYTANNNTKTVTLPIPSGVNNPVVYYVPTSGAAEPVTIVSKTDTTITFETDHFSTYVVGESTEIDVPENETATGSGTTTTTTKKTVYVLSSGNPSGNVLIANSGSASTTTRYLLARNGSSITATEVTILSGDVDGDGDTDTYIELDDATDELWTVADGYTFENGGYYLYYNNGLSLSTSNSTNWSYSTDNHRLYYRSYSTTRYIRYSSSRWQASSSTGSVYFYVPTEVEIETTTTVSGTYAIAGTPAEVTKVVTANTEADLGYTITFTPDEGTATTVTDLGGAATWSIVTVDAYGNAVDGDPNDIISGFNGDTVIFSGNYGTAYVKVSYTWTDDNGDEHTIDNYITIEATEPYYTVELHKAELTKVDITEFAAGVTYYTFDDTTKTYNVATEYVAGTTYYTIPVVKGDEITGPVALKGVEAGDTYSVWAVIKMHTSEAPDGVDQGDVEDDRLYWTVSDTTIASIDLATGLLTFTGKNYGTIQVTVYYLDEDDKILCEDTITISVTDSLYVVPGDGTDDFPEYPNEGAVRFDKTAEAVGNFSQTGIAKVELSMTGVPYSTGSAIDVLLMLDMSTSMDETVGTDSDGNSLDRKDVTVAAANKFLETIVMNDDGTFNANKVAIGYFNGSSVVYVTGTDSSPYISITDASTLATVKSNVTAIASKSLTSSGTYYGTALESAYNKITAQDAVSENTQAFVFMSDGGPTQYTYVNGDSYATASQDSSSTIVGWFTTSDNGTSGDETDDTATPTTSFKTEYYTYKMKQLGYPVYTVGLGLSNNSKGPASYTGLTSGAHEALTSYILSSMATSASYFYNVADDDAVANMGNIFSGIAASIKEAATDVEVEDKIDSHYTVNFGLPSGVTSTEAGMSEFYIQVVDYVLDATTHERTGVYTVLENFTFNADGTLKSHTVDGVACSNCAHVTTTNGKITAIDGTYFDYKSDSTGEYLNWTSEKLSSTELALQYFVYLDKSAGFEAADQVAAGTYNTNEYANLTYTNFQGNRVQQEFPVPQMTWKGAHVTYVFYLVNEAGQPVNRAGKVVPFAEAVYVTVPVTYDVTWNEEAGSENILAKDIFASAGIPSVYELYDPSASYVIRVYQTENVDTNGVNGNYFQIFGSNDKLIDSDMDTDTTVDNSTTKVFNTKAGVKYDEYGVYSNYAVGTTLTNGTNNITTTVEADDIDYANTTVAFAVVWKPELKEDTVVVDFGLDVVIDVITNDNMAAGVVGVRTDVPSGVTTEGTYTRNEANTLTSVELKIGNLKIGKATVENLYSVRFSLDKTNGMQFTEALKFYYEADVNFYNDAGVLQTTSMYSSVTVIPATTIYYEDEYVDLKTFTKNDDGTYKETDGWDTNSMNASATQAQDRPGASQISKDLDADNNYGFDAAYSSMSQFSMGSAAMTNVNAGKYATATFTFYGTGFDIISLTSATTGIITINVYKGATATGDPYVSETVDTYYSYEREYWNVTYTYTDGAWTATSETEVDAMGAVNAAPENPTEGATYTTCEIRWATTATDNSNALYQVPVMKIGDGKTTEALPYGQYTVVITATYIPFLDHNKTDTGYDFYLDAIRIYDPANDGATDDTIEDAYIQDGEYLPDYFEVRDQIISKDTFDSLNSETIGGIVFIDGNANTADVSDYVSYGPNNEVYLANGQAIAFNLNGAYKAPDGMEVAKIQLAVKTVGGTGMIEVYGMNGSTRTDCLKQTVSTATDMYFDITKVDGQTVVIKSTGDAIISITTVKVTYKEPDAVETNSAKSGNAPEAASYSLMSLRNSAAISTMATTTEETTETTETYLFSVSAESVAAALLALNAEEEEVEPDVPVEPEQPEDPEQPEQPEDPEQPEKPEKPGKPGKPGKPDKDDKPGKGHGGKHHERDFDDKPGHNHSRGH